MTTNRPYLLRALYQWIVDNQMTPYVVVNAEYEGAIVPEAYVEKGRIVLNVSPTAVRDFVVTNTLLSFVTRFSGVVTSVHAPVRAILAIYAKENGRGMVFEMDEDDDDGSTAPIPPTPPKNTGNRPHLVVVK